VPASRIYPRRVHDAASSNRRALRRSVEVPCQVVRERDFRLVARHMLDLSEEGMLVTSFARVLTGEPLVVSFMAPFSRAWIDLEATVARVLHGRRPTDRARALGLHFEPVGARARALLCGELAWFRPARSLLRTAHHP
jgi:hypothetical protein